MKVVIDTNVLIVANNHSPQASSMCVARCKEKLDQLKKDGILVLDSNWEILKEYLKKLKTKGKLDSGDEFLLWVMQNRTNPNRCEIFIIYVQSDHKEKKLAFPDDPRLEKFHKKDRKFAALAAVSGAPVWNATDSDWWIFKDVLRENRIIVEFLCSECFERVK